MIISRMIEPAQPVKIIVLALSPRVRLPAPTPFPPPIPGLQPAFAFPPTVTPPSRKFAPAISTPTLPSSPSLSMACPAVWALPPCLAASLAAHRGRIRGPLPRCSLHDDSRPPSSAASSPPDPGTGPAEGRRRPQAQAQAGVVRSERDPVPAEGSRKGGLKLGLRLLRRRPLWKRIFFASKKVRSLILLNVITVVYASDIPVLKEVEMITDPALFTAVRFALTVIPFIPFVIGKHGDRQTRSAGIELGFWVSLAYLTQAIGLLTSEAGRATFISALTVIIVPLIDGLFGATVPALTWIGAVASLVGVALMECDGSLPCVGDILNFLSAVFFGIHMLRTEHISRSTKREEFLALLGYEVIVVAFSSVLWFFFKEFFGESHQFNVGSWTWSTMSDWMISFPWIPALYTGMFSTGLCLWAEIDAMRDTSAAETAIIYGLEPVWGAAFAWFLLGERWGTMEWIGAAFLLGGSLTVQILGSSTQKSKKDEETRRSSPLNASDKRNNLSLSTVLVDSRENTSKLYRKKEKL